MKNFLTVWSSLLGLVVLSMSTPASYSVSRNQYWNTQLKSDEQPATWTTPGATSANRNVQSNANRGRISHFRPVQAQYDEDERVITPVDSESVGTELENKRKQAYLQTGNHQHQNSEYESFRDNFEPTAEDPDFQNSSDTDTLMTPELYMPEVSQSCTATRAKCKTPYYATPKLMTTMATMTSKYPAAIILQTLTSMEQIKSSASVAPSSRQSPISIVKQSSTTIDPPKTTPKPTPTPIALTVIKPTTEPARKPVNKAEKKKDSNRGVGKGFSGGGSGNKWKII